MAPMNDVRNRVRSRLEALTIGGVVAASLALATLALVTVAIALVEGPFGVRDASWLYLIAVVVGAWALGTAGGVVVGLIAFVAYDFLFTAPRLTLVVADPREWLELLLFLFVAAVVGTLVGVARARAETARTRALEAESVARMSRAVALRSLEEALPDVARHLRDDLDLERVWIELGPGEPTARADTDATSPRPGPSLVLTLSREDPVRWIASRPPALVRARASMRAAAHASIVRVPIASGRSALGVIEALTLDSAVPGTPRWKTASGSRLLALAADVVALAAERDRLASATVDAEVARRADALKSRLVASVSHDMRTPLAAIRAAAGTILDGRALDEDARQAAATIEAEAGRLDRMVRGLLDLGRIEAGTLRPRLEPCDLGALVETSIERIDGLLGARPISVDVPDTLPPVLVDEGLFDHVLGNLLENVARHAPAPAPLRVLAVDGVLGVRLVVEDGGPGLSAGRARQLFRSGDPGPAVDDRGGGAPGTGIGLSVVRGLAAAMAIGLSSAPSELGGLAVSLEIRASARPPDEAAA